MRYSGEGSEGILIIAEAPNEDEDLRNEQTAGSSGQRLNNLLRKFNCSLEKDCFKTHSVNCRPVNKDGKCATPTSKQIEYCKPYVNGVITETKPKKIFLLGETALESYYSGRSNHLNTMTKAHGMKIWDSRHNAWIFPMHHHQYIEDNNHNDLLAAEWERCFKRAVQSDPAPLKKVWNKCIHLKDYGSAIAALENCLQNEKVIAIDFETTGLDMYKEGHKTVSFAWANSRASWSVAVEHPYWKRKEQRAIKTLVKKILRKRKIAKIVQNITFEYQWTKAVLKTEPRNFFYDTQLATHVLNNRAGITPLKLQVFVRWGIEDYDKNAANYITVDERTGFNRMQQMPIDQLLEYNALDTLYTYALYEEQLGEFVGKEFDAYEFMHDGALVLCEMSFNGINIEEAYYEQVREELISERTQLHDAVMNSFEVRKYKKFHGEFNYDSPQDLQKMLFGVLKLDPIRKTKTGYSVDEDTLKKINIELTENILKIRKISKMISTYIDGFVSKTYGGEMHPYFSLARARSFRSSSQSPNFQNVPKRDPKAKRITRSGMVPRRGRVLGEMDFSGAEIVTSIYYHKDPYFIEYQTSGNADMHQDAAAHILKIEPSEVPKQVRQAIKGGFTFSQFYGSYYVSCATQMWEELPNVVDGDGNTVIIRGLPINEYIKRTFKNYKNFENHVKVFENIFWNQWFPVYTKWKKDMVAEYKRTGYVETFLGFRFKGYMDKKQCTNYPIQGTSFHLLLYTASKFWKEVKGRGLKTLLIGQIHDSLILDIPIEEVNEVRDILTKIVRTMHTKFAWMSVPMDLELEVSEPYEDGGSFAKMHKLELAA